MTPLETWNTIIKSLTVEECAWLINKFSEKDSLAIKIVDLDDFVQSELDGDITSVEVFLLEDLLRELRRRMNEEIVID